VVYFTILSVSRFRSIEWQGDRLIGTYLRGTGSGIIVVLSMHLPGGTDKNHEIPLRIFGVPAEIGTEHLPNTSLKRYH
jgi:hypothetical protein